MSGSIWKIILSSGVAYELTRGQKYHSSPAFSPDGKWIAYTADDGRGVIQLEILNVETGITKPLTNDGFIYAEPSFSSDGTKLAFVSTKPGGHFNVYVRPIRDGTWSGEEIAVTHDHRHPKNRPYFGSWDMHTSPAWMPDADSLLLISNRNVELGSGNLVAVPAIDSGIEAARVVSHEQTLFRSQPAISRDGTHYFYSSTRGSADQFSNIYVAPLSGGEPYKVTFFAYDAFQPRLSPDGERIAFLTNRDGSPQLELMEVNGGARRAIQVRKRYWKHAAGSVRVRTIDNATGRATACRVSLRASDGKAYIPPRKFALLSDDGRYYFYSNGEFEVEVPVGRLSIKLDKGFTYQTITDEVVIKEGNRTNLILPLSQTPHGLPAGWQSGTTHTHLNYGGTFRGQLKDLLNMAEAEGVSVINMLVANKDNRVIDYQYFVPGGSGHPSSNANTLLIVGQEYRPVFYGHVVLLGLKQHLVSPFSRGLTGTALANFYPANADILKKAKAQGAIVGYGHGFSGDADPLEADLGSAKSFPVDVALDAVDLLEWSESGRAGFFPWYALLNCGFHVVASGGEDSIVTLSYGSVFGSIRTFVYTGKQRATVKDWLRGLKAGHSFISNGPLMQFTVAGKLPGGQVEIGSGGGVVSIEGWVRSLKPLSKVELIFNGQVLRQFTLSPDGRSCHFRERLTVNRSGWFHLRAEGERSSSTPGYQQAFSNPVWVIVGSKRVRDGDSASYLVRWIDKFSSLVDKQLSWNSPVEKQRIFSQIGEARQRFESLALEKQ